MQDLDIWKSYSMVNPDDVPAEDSASEISFLVNGCDISSVSASRYITVLPFAYFPSLNAVAIEFPLDVSTMCQIIILTLIYSTLRIRSLCDFVMLIYYVSRVGSQF